MEIMPNNLDLNVNSAFDKYCNLLTSEIELNERILFVQTPQVILDAFNTDIALHKGYYIFPPTGIQYLCGSIKDFNLDVQILDLNFEILKKVHNDPTFDVNNWDIIFEEKLKSFNPSIICISCLFDVGISAMLKVIDISRHFENSIVIGGGVIATYERTKLLSEGSCHFVVEGEGESKLNYLLGVLYGKKNQVSIPGIHFNLNGKYEETSGAPAPDVINLAGNIIDSYKLINISEYSKYGSLNPFSRSLENEEKPFAAIQLGRGCRAACTFCAVRDFMGKGVRFRNLDDIISEIEYLVESEKVQHFELLDDDPTFYKEEFKAFCREIINRKWNITWSASNGMIATSIDKEMLGLIRDSGCIGFSIGVESGNKKMLKKVQKPGSHKRFLQFGQMLNDVPEMFVKANYIVGLPEETFGQMLDSFWFSLEDNMDWGAFTVCQIIRGASAFADSGEYFESQMDSKGLDISNFIPSRLSSKGEINIEENIKIGMDVFLLDQTAIPSVEQVKEIWFTFNVLSNYVFNKNLSANGKPTKFINWIERVRIAYPTNPNMNIFLSYAYILDNNKKLSKERFIDANKNLLNNEYWIRRINSFNLESLYNIPPLTAEDVYRSIGDLRSTLLVEIEKRCGSSRWDPDPVRIPIPDSIPNYQDKIHLNTL